MNDALKKAARTASIGVALYGGVTIIGTFLASTPLAALVAQTVGTEWGAGRLGITWSDPNDDAPTTNAIAKRVGKGAIVGLLIGGLILESLQITHSVELRPASFALGGLITGLLAAIFTGVRDQILLSGLVLRVMGGTNARLPRILACGAMSAAHAFIAPTPAIHEIVAAGALGLFAGAWWVRERGAFFAVSMNAGFVFATQTLFRGVLVDVTGGATPFAGGDAGMGSGYAAAGLLLACAVVTFLTSKRGTRSARHRT